MNTEFKHSILQLTAKIVADFVKNNEISPEELPGFIKNLYADLFRELIALNTPQNKPQITKEILEALLIKMQNDKKYYVLGNTNLRKILLYHCKEPSLN